MDTTFVPPSPNSLEPISVQTQGFVPPPPESIEPAATPAIGSPPPISTFSGSFPSAMSVPPPRPFNRYLQLAAENPTVPGMEKIGGVAPGVPKPPEPPIPLETDLQMNPLVPEGEAGVARPFMNMMGRGAGQAMSGIEALAAPTQAAISDMGRTQLAGMGHPLPGKPAMTQELAKQGAGGLHEIVGGAMGLATPFLMGATAAAPLRTGAAIGVFSGAQKGVERGLQALGLPPEYAGVAGDLAGFLAGAAAHRLLPPEQANLKSTLMHRMADKVATGEPTETATPPPEQQQFSITGQPIRQAGVEAKPEPPTKTKIVTAETPNPATASLPTVKESDATLAIQTQQLLNGTRRVVMFSHGEGQPADAPGPPGLIGVTHGSVPGMNGLPKNTYWYRTDLIYPSEIHRAEKMNDLNSVLGPTTGLDTPDKSQIPEGSPVVTTRAADGTEVQATATPVENVLQTASAHQPLVPPGGATTVEGPDGILQDRATQGVAPNPTQNVVNEPQLSTGTPPPTGSPVEPPHVANIELSRTYEDPGTNSTFYGYNAVDQNGVPLAEIKLWDNHDGTAMVDVVTNPEHPQAIAGAHSAGALKIGPGEVRQALAFIQRQHPQIRKLEFERVGKPNPETGRSITLRGSKDEKGTSGELFRGAADFPPTPEGRTMAARIGQMMAGLIDRIIGGTLLRHQVLEEAIADNNPQAGHPEQTEEVNPLTLGLKFEGEKVTPKRIQALNQHMRDDFDKPLEGVGKHSGKPGEVPADWFNRLINRVESELAQWKPGQRVVIVTSGRDIQAIRAWAAANFDGVDFDVLTSEWKTPPGGMIRIDPPTRTITDATNVNEPGVYVIRHPPTEANAGRSAATGPADNEFEQMFGVSSEQQVFDPSRRETLGLTPRRARELAAQAVRKADREHGTTPTSEVAARLFPPESGAPELRAGAERLPPEGRGGAAQGTPAPSPADSAAVPTPGPRATGTTTGERRLLGYDPGSPGNIVEQFLMDESGESEIQKVPDELRRAVAPQTRGEEAREAMGTLREMMGRRMLLRDRAEAAFRKFKRYFYKNEPKELGFYGLNVVDAMEGGDTSGLRRPESRQFAEAAKLAYANRATQLVDEGIVKEENIIQNYVSHLYEDDDALKGFVGEWMAKRSFVGSESFRRKRVFPTYREGLEYVSKEGKQLKPKYDNPVDLLMAGLSAMDRSITGHQAFREWYEHNYLVYVRAGKKGPAGWAPIKDKIFTVFGPHFGAVKLPSSPTIGRGRTVNIAPEDVEVIGRREMGSYWAPEGMAQVADNWLSETAQGSSLFRILMNIKGAMNALNLVSYFHALTTSFNSAVSDLSLGMKYLAEGKPQDAAPLVAKAATGASVIPDLVRGNRLTAVWDGTATNPTPEEIATVEAMVKAGFGPHQSDFNPDRWWNGAMDSFAKGENAKAAAKLANPLLHIERAMKPLMSWMVPYAKMAAAQKGMLFEIQKHPGMPFTEARYRFGKVGDSIDNRFGQLNQNNLFLNGAFRSVMNGLVGRPGWTIGTIKELLGGWFVDPVLQFRDYYNGDDVEMSHKTAYAIAVVIMTAWFNGMLTYFLTGKKPEGMDFIAFRDGGTNEDGTPSRMVFGSYVTKDVYAWTHDTLGTLVGKANPAITMASEWGRNYDYYRHKIHGEGGQGTLQWALKSRLPYPVTQYMRNRESAQPLLKSTLLPAVGIAPAPRSMTLSPARSYLSDFMREHSDMIRANPSDHSRAMTQVIVSAHKDPEAAQRMGDQFVTEGKMSDRDVKSALNRAGKQPIVGELEWAGGLNQYTQLSYANVTAIVNAYDKANKTEREQIDGALKGKIQAKLSRVRNEPWKWTDNTRELAAKYFDVQPDIGSPPPIR